MATVRQPKRHGPPFFALSTNPAGDVSAFDAYLGVGCTGGEDLTKAIDAALIVGLAAIVGWPLTAER